MSVLSRKSKKAAALGSSAFGCAKERNLRLAAQGITIDEAELAAQEYAAVRIQAMQRGKQDRRRVQDQKDSQPPPAAEYAPHTEEADSEAALAAQEEAELAEAALAAQEYAATRIQAIQRGKQDRRRVQDQKASELPPAVEAPAVDEAELAAQDEAELAEAALAAQEYAATRIQAMQRGKQERRKVEDKKASGVDDAA